MSMAGYELVESKTQSFSVHVIWEFHLKHISINLPIWALYRLD